MSPPRGPGNNSTSRPEFHVSISSNARSFLNNDMVTNILSIPHLGRLCDYVFKGLGGFPPKTYDLPAYTQTALLNFLEPCVLWAMALDPHIAKAAKKIRMNLRWLGQDHFSRQQQKDTKINGCLFAPRMAPIQQQHGCQKPFLGQKLPQ